MGQIPANEGAGLRAQIEKTKGARVVYFAEGYKPGDGAENQEWTERVRAEHVRLGKEFLLSSANGESESGGGCAVFGVHAHWLLPAECKEPVAWVRKHLRPLIAESGIFAELRDAAEAKIAARNSKLLSGNVFFHTGDLGDIIAALPTIRHLGGGYLIMGNRHGRGGREVMSQERFDAIAPLLTCQPYITGVERRDDAPGEIRDAGCGMRDARCGIRDDPETRSIVTHDFTLFREMRPPEERRWTVDGGRRTELAHGGAGYNLATWQGKYFGITEKVENFLDPWITVPEPDVHTRLEAVGKAIFARTARYHNPKFDWPKIVKDHGPALFVGLEDEWEEFSKEFCGKVGAEVRHRSTSNLLEVAQLIAGARMFCGNQSVACWIAMGLGQWLIQESDQWNLNSVVERHNAEFVI